MCNYYSTGVVPSRTNLTAKENYINGVNAEMTELSKIDMLTQIEAEIFPPPKKGSENAQIKNLEEYRSEYRRSMEDPDGYWAERAKSLVTWFKEWDQVVEANLTLPSAKWFINAKLNVSYNCLDRHVENGRADKTALIWQGEPENDVRRFTFQELKDEVCRFANVLKKLGVKRGDRVSLFMPMLPELAIAMLACARIGAIHSIVFGGFSSISLQHRIQDCEAVVVVTCDQSLRAGKALPMKKSCDEALAQCPTVKHCVVVKRTGADTPMTPGRDLWWNELMAGANPDCPCEEMDAEDQLFILYTSGSTGRPKGVVHTTGGYLTYAAHTCQYVFDMKQEDIHYCTADIGWITGHTYIVYGPLTIGATSLMFEGVPTWPAPDRFWNIVEKFKATIFYTAPTVIRSLMREGSSWPDKHDLSSLRILGSVGEPINREAWLWYHEVIGHSQLPVVDTWWQTESGGILISPLPYATPLKPGSATLPLPGIDAAILNNKSEEMLANEGGYLIIRKPWPGMLRGVFGDQERFKKTYFQHFPGYYESGDGARQDADGYFWILGRVDDVVNVSGHRLGTAEIETALASHESVAEAAVVGFPHEVKGEAIYAYVTLKQGFAESDALRKVLRAWVRQQIGPIATPDILQFTSGLPKTRSGKIMRRILRKIASHEYEALGDTSTLADPTVLDILIEGQKNMMI